MDSTYTYYLRGPHPSAGYVKHKMQKSLFIIFMGGTAFVLPPVVD